MGKISIDYVFTDKADRMGTREWYTYMLKNEDQYKTCEVVTLTRVKNLKSDWVHEYIQFIVEETTTKERTRVYAERGNEIDLDWVTFGRNESGESALKDLPLPLTSITFTQRPTLLQVAQLLATVTTWGGKYELLGHSCFWFSYSTYDKVKRDFKGSEKRWNLLNIGGRGGGGLHDLWGFGVPYLFGFFWASKANKFRIEREQHRNWGVSGVCVMTPEEAVKDGLEQLFEKKTLKKYLAALELHGIEADEKSIERAAIEAQDSANRLSEQEIKWNEEADKDIEEFCKKILGDSETSENLAAYKASTTDEETGVETLYTGPKAEQFEKLQQAMQAFIGRLIREG